MINKFKKYIIFILIMLTIFIVNIFKFNYSNRYNVIESKKNYESYDIFNFNKGEKYEQTILSKRDNFNNIRIYINPITGEYDSKNEKDNINIYLEMTLKDDKGKKIEQYKFEKLFIREGTAIVNFKFPTIKNSKNKMFYLEIESFDSLNNQPINFARFLSDDDNYILKKDGSNTEFTLMYDTMYKDNKKYTNYILLNLILIILFTIVGIILIKNNKMKIENKFLLISLFLGMLLIILIPAYDGNDEVSHFARTYEITNGQIVTENINDWPQTLIPSKVFDKFRHYENAFKIIKQSNGKKYLYDMQYSAVYPIFSYMPQITAMQLCKIFIKNIFWWPYVVRIFQLLFCVFIIYCSIKIIPYGKKVIFVIGLIPTVLKQISLISADSLLISCSLLFISYILHLNEKKKITKKDIIILTFLAVVMSVSKLVYIPLCFLFLLLLKNIDKKEKIKSFGIIFGIALIVTILWNIFAVSTLTSGQGVNVKYYFKYYLMHPLDYICINLNTIMSCGFKYINEVFSGLNRAYVFSYDGLYSLLFMTIYIYTVIYFKNNIDNKNKKILVIIFLMVCILINSSLLVTCTPIYTEYIVGIQGRYFTPLLLPLALIVGKNKMKKEHFIAKNVDIIIFIIYFSYVLRIAYKYI